MPDVGKQRPNEDGRGDAGEDMAADMVTIQRAGADSVAARDVVIRQGGVRSLTARDVVVRQGVLRDRDAVYGVAFSSRVQTMGIHEVKTAPRSPWQNPYVERLIGTLRRECLDHVVVLNETHLRRLLREYLIYYHGARTHLSLAKDAPEPRRVGAP
jgi:transposase InsO family protein